LDVVFLQATAIHLTGPQFAAPQYTGRLTMIYALTALLFMSLVLAAAAGAAALSDVDRELRGLQIPLTSDF